MTIKATIGALLLAGTAPERILCLTYTKAAATEMQSTASVMTHTADTTSQQATMVAAASEEASANVQTVASAAEQLAMSIREITVQVTRSSDLSNRAVADGAKTNELLAALTGAAENIGDAARDAVPAN